MVSRSSTKSEYQALSHAAYELIWFCSLLQELRLPFALTPIVWCDNLSATILAYILVFHARTKHIEIDAHLSMIEFLLASRLETRHIASHLTDS